jgi:hypothetical protein
MTIRQALNVRRARLFLEPDFDFEIAFPIIEFVSANSRTRWRLYIYCIAASTRMQKAQPT